MVLVTCCHRGEREWAALGPLQQVPPGRPQPPPALPGEPGWEGLSERGGIPPNTEHRQPAGPQGWDGLHQPRGLLVGTHTHAHTRMKKWLTHHYLIYSFIYKRCRWHLFYRIFAQMLLFCTSLLKWRLTLQSSCTAIFNYYFKVLAVGGFDINKVIFNHCQVKFSYKLAVLPV